MKIRNEYTRPLELVHDIIKGKWKTIIIFQLRDGKCSFTDLKRGILGISQKMLLEQLRELKYFKLIDKKGISYQDIHTKKVSNLLLISYSILFL